jgi:hypothetical protein
MKKIHLSFASPKTKKALKVLLIIALFTVLITAAGILTWFAYFKPQAKMVTGINLYRQPIVVKAAGQEKRLDVFDTYSFTVQADKEILVSIYDEAGTLLDENVANVTNTTSYITDIWSAEDSVKLCFVEADVTPLIYKIEGQTQAVGAIKTVVSEAAASGQISYKFKPDYYLYMDNYNIDALPAEIPASSAILGFYPVSCENLGDNELLQDEIIQWSLYDPAKQREMYNAEVEKILGSPEYN